MRMEGEGAGAHGNPACWSGADMDEFFDVDW